MGNLAINPYINFGGKAREAFEFYQKALGGELTLMAFNPGGAPKPAGPDEGIMHGTLKLSDGVVVMGSDGMVDYPAKVGDNFAIALSGSNHEKLAKAFEMLSEGGKVKQNLKDESWGDTSGWLEDKFGINWMVNITKGHVYTPPT
ncbi:MAG TPA: VOC family protein [Candidatus Saccharimonadales bacterium]|nr:VOC family protein [Candidatus Saccharimonadales bacterium]